MLGSIGLEQFNLKGHIVDFLVEFELDSEPVTIDQLAKTMEELATEENFPYSMVEELFGRYPLDWMWIRVTTPNPEGIDAKASVLQFEHFREADEPL